MRSCDENIFSQVYLLGPVWLPSTLVPVFWHKKNTKLNIVGVTISSAAHNGPFSRAACWAVQCLQKCEIKKENNERNKTGGKQKPAFTLSHLLALICVFM